MLGRHEEVVERGGKTMRVEFELDGTTGEISEVMAWVIGEDGWRDVIELPLELIGSIGVQFQNMAWKAKAE